MLKALRILHLEDEPDYSALIRAMLEAYGFQVEMLLAGNYADFVAALRKQAFDIILADYNLPTCNGIQALEEARKLAPDTPFLLVSGMIGEHAAIESLKHGATDYVLKQWPERLVPAVRRALDEANERRQRKQAETELIRREKYFRNLTANSLDVLTILSREGLFQYNSPALKRVLGYDPEDLAGKNAFALVHPDDFLNATRAFERALKNPELRVTTEFRFNRRDGSWCDLEVVGQNRLDDPDIAGVVLNVRDISERKKLELQLSQAQKMEAIGQLAGGIAHDFNNILSPILMSVQMLGEDLPPHEKERVLTTVKECTQRGAGIVRQLLWLGRGLEGKRVVLNLKHVIKDIARFLNETFPKSIQLETEVSPEVWPILADPTHIHQVLLNLCLNSRDVMTSGGRLSISAKNFRPEPDFNGPSSGLTSELYIVLQVSDTGPGIPPEIRSRIFDPFFTTKEPGKGTGLGLSSVQSIVKSYNGFIQFESQTGKGTTFKVYLPAHSDLPAEKGETEKAGELPRGHGQTVLVVDDEESMLNTVERVLQTFGYNVLTAKNGEQALAAYLANQATIAVVLTDLMMPVMDGPTTIRALKQINPRVKVIAASGLGSDPNREALSDLDVKYFVSKPYTAKTILTILHEILNEGETE
jgi:two-component system cell cycle sensor histidine kinase/response regulator CckA